MACLAFIWLVAMAVGMAFKRYMLGAKGWEQIPFLDWYKAFGNLESVSCFPFCVSLDEVMNHNSKGLLASVIIMHHEIRRCSLELIGYVH